MNEDNGLCANDGFDDKSVEPVRCGEVTDDVDIIDEVGDWGKGGEREDFADGPADKLKRASRSLVASVRGFDTPPKVTGRLMDGCLGGGDSFVGNGVD